MPQNIRAEIEAVVHKYLDGLYEGDADLLASVFHPSSALVREQDGTVSRVPVADWLAAVRGRPSPKARGIVRNDEVLQIDEAGPTTGFAKVKCAIPPRNPTDYLSLVKADGRWQIVQKVYAVQQES